MILRDDYYNLDQNNLDKCIHLNSFLDKFYDREINMNINERGKPYKLDGTTFNVQFDQAVGEYKFTMKNKI